jgi:hypothetical protein
MTEIRFIKRKFKNSYLVWLQNSNTFIQLEESAWFVFRKTVSGFKAETIAAHCELRYGLSPEESNTFVNDIRSSISLMNQSIKNTQSKEEFSNELAKHTFSPYSIHRYCFGNKFIDFSFETRMLKDYLHPLICHLETNEAKDKITVFELFGYGEKIVFRLNNKVKGVWNNDESHLVKGMIFMKLINVMFDKIDNDWLMTVHASAITNGKKTILISAGSGSGKTTMAALLQDCGYPLVSDDFVPIDRFFHAYPFPIAMSVKQGSLNLLSSIYHNLEQRPVSYITPEKSVRYLIPDNDLKFDKVSFPVKEFVFIQYNKSVDFEWEKLDPITAVKILLDQVWIPPFEENAGILMDQLSKWSFYQLTYSNNQKAIDAITNIFGHD